MDDVFEKEYTYQEIIENLKDDKVEDFVKIFSIINIEKIENQQDFFFLINHLTNHSTPVREICAIKLEEISNENIEFFINEESRNQIIKGIIDTNPNVSRSICSIIEKNSKIQELIQKDLITKAQDILTEIKAYQQTHNDYCEQKNKKSHAKNKMLFPLYWYLEAISSCLTNKNNSKVLEIVKYAITLPDYTIREKCAKILLLAQKIPTELLQKAINDQNFYVKNLVYDKINIETV